MVFVTWLKDTVSQTLLMNKASEISEPNLPLCGRRQPNGDSVGGAVLVRGVGVWGTFSGGSHMSRGRGRPDG